MLLKLKAIRPLQPKTLKKPCTLLAIAALQLLTCDSEKFTQAIEIEPGNHVLYSNRSGAYASLKNFDKALEDANKTTEVKPDWAKGWGRKGAALHGQGDLRMKQDYFGSVLI
jgi:tetratricopeptide (TPR) repeat protein